MAGNPATGDGRPANSASPRAALRHLVHAEGRVLCHSPLLLISCEIHRPEARPWFQQEYYRKLSIQMQ